MEEDIQRVVAECVQAGQFEVQPIGGHQQWPYAANPERGGHLLRPRIGEWQAIVVKDYVAGYGAGEGEKGN